MSPSRFCFEIKNLFKFGIVKSRLGFDIKGDDIKGDSSSNFRFSLVTVIFLAVQNQISSQEHCGSKLKKDLGSDLLIMASLGFPGAFYGGAVSQ